MKEHSILIGGSAGDGSKKAGLIIAKLLSSYGYQIYIHEDYQSVIRGGHNFSLIRASNEKVLTHRDEIDLLNAFNEDTIKRHTKRLKDKDMVIYNSDAFEFDRGNGFPIETIAKNIGGLLIMKNTALVGAFAKTVGIDWNTLKKVLISELKVATDKNLLVAKEAYKTAKAKMKIPKLSSYKRPLISGNSAIVLGSLKAGLDSYFAYPMTPATSILNCMAQKGVKYGVKVFQPENEIAVANAAIGAAFAGSRVMIGTSGGGFALMNEALSFAAQAEIPLVVVNVSRSGPSTGLPTYGGQSDLFHVLSAGHGDFDRFVVAPGDPEEAFYLTQLTMDIAWRYQIPSVILSDKDLAECTYSFDPDSLEKYTPGKLSLWDRKGEYKRFKITKDGVSPIAFPGEKGAVVKATSYEHDEFGIAIEDEKTTKLMQDKRSRKFKSLEKEISKIKAVKVYGNKKSKTAIIAWGSVKGAAIEFAKEKNIKMIQPLIMSPFPEKQIKRALLGVSRIITVETNNRGQLAQLLRYYGIESKSVLKYTGRLFTTKELISKIKI